MEAEVGKKRKRKPQKTCNLDLSNVTAGVTSPDFWEGGKRDKVNLSASCHINFLCLEGQCHSDKTLLVNMLRFDVLHKLP